MSSIGVKRGTKGNGTISKRTINGIQYYVGRYTVGRDPGTNKQIQKSVYGKTQKEVATKLREIAHQQDEGTYISPAKMTCRQWFETWLTDYNLNIKENTAVSYRVQVNTNILPYIGALQLTSIDRDRIQKLIVTLAKREESPLSPKSCKNVHGIMHKAFEQAVLNGFIPKNPCTHIDLPASQKKVINPLDEAEIKSFLAAIQGHENELLFKVALFTGARQAELMGLQWQNVDFDSGTITISQQMIHEKQKGGRYKLASTKTATSVRTLTPAPVVMDWLKEQKRNQAKNRLLMGDQYGDEFDGLVFTTPDGRHLSNTTASHQAHRIGQKIGKPGFRFHDLRHTYAVMSLRAGDDLKTISSNMGHATIGITMDTYAAFTQDMARDSSARMARYMAALNV